MTLPSLSSFLYTLSSYYFLCSNSECLLYELVSTRASVCLLQGTHFGAMISHFSPSGRAAQLGISHDTCRQCLSS